MTEVDARKILGIPRSANLKSAERAYLEKRNNLRLYMLQGNTRPVREQARSELVELTNAWNAMQMKRTTKSSQAKPKQPTSKRYPKAKRPASKPRQTKQTAALDPRQDMAYYWDFLIDMVPLPKSVVLAILIIEFAAVITILFLRTMKGT